MRLDENGTIQFSGPKSLANFEKLAAGLKLKPSELLTYLLANQNRTPNEAFLAFATDLNSETLTV